MNRILSTALGALILSSRDRPTPAGNLFTSIFVLHLALLLAAALALPVVAVLRLVV